MFRIFLTLVTEPRCSLTVELGSFVDASIMKNVTQLPVVASHSSDAHNPDRVENHQKRNYSSEKHLLASEPRSNRIDDRSHHDNQRFKRVQNIQKVPSHQRLLVVENHSKQDQRRNWKRESEDYYSPGHTLRSFIDVAIFFCFLLRCYESVYNIVELKEEGNCLD